MIEEHMSIIRGEELGDPAVVHPDYTIVQRALLARRVKKAFPPSIWA